MGKRIIPWHGINHAAIRVAITKRIMFSFLTYLLLCFYLHGIIYLAPGTADLFIFIAGDDQYPLISWNYDERAVVRR